MAPEAPLLSQGQRLRGLLQVDTPWPECRQPPAGAGLGGNRLWGLVALRAGGWPWWEGQGWQRSRGVP